MDVGIIGPGRLGRSLALLLERAGHSVDLVGRGGVPRGEVVLLTVPDGQIEAAAAALPPGPIVLHCSGATEVIALRPHEPAGSMHPLMTFPGPDRLPDLRDVPAAIAGDPRAVGVARALATSLGMLPVEIPGDRRLYHAAAVMAGNFATVLLAEAARALVAAGVPAERAPAVLAPLALQSIRNATSGPAASLTGPVARGDLAVLEAHRLALHQAGLDDLATLHEDLAQRAHRLLVEASRPLLDGTSDPER